MKENETPSTNVSGASIERIIQVNPDAQISFVPTDEVEAKLYGDITDGVRQARAEQRTTEVIKERLEGTLGKSGGFADKIVQERQNRGWERE
jgi:hypothetical protein